MLVEEIELSSSGFSGEARRVNGGLDLSVFRTQKCGPLDSLKYEENTSRRVIAVLNLIVQSCTTVWRGLESFLEIL